MKQDFDYRNVPFGFLHCLNQACPRAEECVRHQLVKLIPAERVSISALNPALASENGKGCPYFLEDKLVRYAAGTKRLLDNVPQKDAIYIKDRMLAHFGRNNFYRFRNKQRLISPEEQEYIRKLFRSRGINEEPTYEEYIEQYEWESTQKRGD